MSEAQNLGTVGIWQIKNFPDGLRKAIVERAAFETEQGNKVTVADLLTRIMVAVIDADWQVGDAVNPSATRATRPPQQPDSLTTIERAIAAAAVLAGTKGVPQDFRRDANARLREHLGPPRTAATIESPKQLPAPPLANGADTGDRLGAE